MFGKRKDDHKHRYAEDRADEFAEVDDDPEFQEALKQLGLNARATLDAHLDTTPPTPERRVAGVLTAGELAQEDEAAATAEPAIEPSAKPSSGGEGAKHAALKRERRKVAENHAALDQTRASLAEAEARIASLTADLEDARARGTSADEQNVAAAQAAAAVRVAEARATAAEGALAEAQGRVESLTAELERVRSEAAALGVERDRLGRESAERDSVLAAAEQRFDEVTAEADGLRSDLAVVTAEAERLRANRVELLRRQSEQEAALTSAVEQMEESAGWAESVAADNLRLSQELAATVQAQAGTADEVARLQRQLDEQRAAFEAQADDLRRAESRHSAEVHRLAHAVTERDSELALLRQMLLDLEAQRAEEAAAFLSALGS